MKRKNVLIYILAAAIAVSGILFYTLKNRGDEGREIIISRESTKDYILDKYDDGFVTYNGVELIHYDSDMEQQWVCMIDEAGAAVYVEGKYILLFGENDRIVSVKDGKIVTDIKSDKALRRASVNENGCITALTSDRGYKGQCFVYSDAGKLMAEFSFGEKYILGAYLMSDNKTLVMNVIDDKDNGYISKILYADIKRGEIKKEIEADGINSYMKLYRDKVFSVNGRTLYCYDKNGNEKWSYDIGSENIYNIGFSGNYISMAVKSKDNFGAAEIITFKLGGRLKGRYAADAQITAFDVSEGCTAVCVNGKIILLNSGGKVVSEIEAQQNTDSIKLFGNDKVLMISEKAVMQRFGR